jgi:hypothetical protein
MALLKKGVNMETHKKELLRKQFADEIDRIDRGLCPLCESPIDYTSFKDPLSKREFEISGMCQSCQDSIFPSETNMYSTEFKTVSWDVPEGGDN